MALIIIFYFLTQTWYDWKSNFAKRVETSKNFAANIEERSTILSTNPSKDDLFLTSEASEISNISEGGTICETSVQNSLKENSSLKLPNFASQSHLTVKKTLCTERLEDATSSSLQSDVNEVINIVLLQSLKIITLILSL